MSIAKNLFDIVSETLEGVGKNQVVQAIDLKIGKLRAVIPESLEFCFEVISRGTVLEGAKLRIEEIPVRLRCGDCGKVSEITEPLFQCKKCGSMNVDLIAGKELEVNSIEVMD